MREKEAIKETLTRWSLERVQFLLAHIEDFIDDEAKELKERAKNFVAESGLEKIEKLVESDPNDSHLPLCVLERLTPFFEAGLLLQRGPADENAGWWVTDLFWRGSVFHLEIGDQVQANSLIPELSPLQVNRAPAQEILQRLKMNFLTADADADAFLLKPTPATAYVLISRLAPPWSQDHVAQASRLVNKSFIY